MVQNIINPYFDHMIKLDKNLTKQYMDKSGICHHMIFETKYIKILFNKIERIHNDTFYNIFLKNVIEFLQLYILYLIPFIMFYLLYLLY